MADNPLARIESLLRHRAPFYAKVKHQVDTSDLRADEVVHKVLDIVQKDRRVEVEVKCCTEGTSEPERTS